MLHSTKITKLSKRYSKTEQEIKAEHRRGKKIKALNKYVINETTPETYVCGGIKRLILFDKSATPNLFEYQGDGFWDSLQESKCT